jgi:hypothetical protein
MPTEADAIAWFHDNWPSLVMGLALAKSYLKLRQFPVRLARMERQQKRLLDVVIEKYPEEGERLFRDEEGKEE